MDASNNNHANGNKTSELSVDEASASWNTCCLNLNGFEGEIILGGAIIKYIEGKSIKWEFNPRVPK